MNNIETDRHVRLESDRGQTYLRPSEVSQVYLSGKEGFTVVIMDNGRDYHLIPGTPDEVAAAPGL